ncbi:MAG: type IV pilin N-terminal domain-containing protein [Methanoregula sp.]|jgi:FlaG/FlaF family flagellin (archaellin)|uniref:type IV pilin N-terminal domain-containing protein n=1 Tax=Methanoregula sp. TaxID=2052170 RepID=UPI0025E1F678|nr:type IV pilin N-terminal domain-containing protein [Methanoregula sp.]MCK9630627.1 type IV pilin N-terminal domain-containing protein [Methanoregula sp.]
MLHNYRGDSGVSEVVGEMLMVALVIVLLAVFSAALYNYLPTDRDPSITIKMSNDTRNITLWHKGGDWVKKVDLTVVIGTADSSRRIPWNNANFTLVPDKDVFDLGSNITVTVSQDLDLWGNESVKLVTPHTVIYTGRIGP